MSATKTKAKTKTSAIPATATKLKHRRLAEGEVTGHYHEATGPGVTLHAYGHDRIYLDAPEGAVITHQEHGPVTLPPGEYSRAIVKEYDHLAEETRSVVD